MNDRQHSSEQHASERHSVRHFFATFLFFASSLLLIVSGCSQPSGHTQIVPDSTLVLILTDLYTADAASTIRAEHRAGRPDSLMFQEMQLGTRDQIIEDHGVSVDQFTSAMQLFIADPPRYVALYNQVLDRLNLERRSSEADEDNRIPSG